MMWVNKTHITWLKTRGKTRDGRTSMTVKMGKTRDQPHSQGLFPILSAGHSGPWERGWPVTVMSVIYTWRIRDKSLLERSQPTEGYVPWQMETKICFKNVSFYWNLIRDGLAIIRDRFFREGLPMNSFDVTATRQIRDASIIAVTFWLSRTLTVTGFIKARGLNS